MTDRGVALESNESKEMLHGGAIPREQTKSPSATSYAAYAHLDSVTDRKEYSLERGWRIDRQAAHLHVTKTWRRLCLLT